MTTWPPEALLLVAQLLPKGEDLGGQEVCPRADSFNEVDPFRIAERVAPSSVEVNEPSAARTL
jgi:hypothetical protein